MTDIDVSDYDFSGTSIYELNELTYIGELYHYTHKDGCDGIFNPKTSDGKRILLPPNHIALRFTRTADNGRNDDKERRHINDTVKRVAEKLQHEPKDSDRYISADFAEIVQNYQNLDTGYYTVISEKINKELRNHQIKWGYGAVNYYIACFSTNPNNEYIMESFKCPIRLSFRHSFSAPNEKKKGYLGGIPCEVIGLYKRLSPFSNLNSAFLTYYIGKVLYDDAEKCKLIEKYLLSIYKHYTEKQSIEDQLQDMYYLYDAFFKNSYGAYWKEEEVRFVIKLSSEVSQDALKQYGFVFDSEIRNGRKYDYVYLPVDKEFLIGGKHDK